MHLYKTKTELKPSRRRSTLKSNERYILSNEFNHISCGRASSPIYTHVYALLHNCIHIRTPCVQCVCFYLRSFSLIVIVVVVFFFFFFALHHDITSMAYVVHALHLLMSSSFSLLQPLICRALHRFGPLRHIHSYCIIVCSFGCWLIRFVLLLLLPSFFSFSSPFGLCMFAVHGSLSPVAMCANMRALLSVALFLRAYVCVCFVFMRTLSPWTL